MAKRKTASKPTPGLGGNPYPRAVKATFGVVAEATRRSMQSNRAKDSQPELALRKALWAAGMRGYRKNVASLPGKPDIVFHRRRLCIFVHGCFWHGCPSCSSKRNLRPSHNADYWAAKREENHIRDARQMEELKRRGWRVIVVWECELKRDGAALVISSIEN